MKHLRLYEEFIDEAKMSDEAKVDVILKMLADGGYKVKSHKLDYEEVGRTKMPELCVYLDKPYKDDPKFDKELRDKLSLRDTPRVEAYPKEKDGNPVVIDLF